MPEGEQGAKGIGQREKSNLTTKFTPLEVKGTSKERGRIRSKEDGECCIDDYVNSSNGEHEETRREKPII